LGVLIDASILIGHERGNISLESHLAGREEEEFFLSVVTASELLHGVHRAVDSNVRERRSAFVEAVLERCFQSIWLRPARTRDYGPG
jgi:tRNA(fMet)-specific endonuclease VapC